MDRELVLRAEEVAEKSVRMRGRGERMKEENSLRELVSQLEVM